jgi:hypothetical protein
VLVRRVRGLALLAHHVALEVLYRLLVCAALHGGVVERGFAPHYSPGLMARVAARRDIAPVACMVSRPRGPIGGWVWVYGKRTGALLHCKIVDVSHPRDLARHIKLERQVEIAFENTVALCGSTKGSVKECPVLVIQE